MEFTVWEVTGDAPTGPDDELTPSDYRTITLTTDEVEMHLFYITAQTGDTASLHMTSIDGSNGFGDRQ